MYAANFRLAPLAERLGVAAPGAPAVAAYAALFGALFALYALAALLVLGPARRVSSTLPVGFGLGDQASAKRPNISARSTTRMEHLQPGFPI